MKFNRKQPEADPRIQESVEAMGPEIKARAEARIAKELAELDQQSTSFGEAKRAEVTASIGEVVAKHANDPNFDAAGLTSLQDAFNGAIDRRLQDATPKTSDPSPEDNQF